MRLYERDDWWWVNVRFEGVRHRLKSPINQKRAAEQYAHRVMEQLINGTFVSKKERQKAAAKTKTVAEFAPDFIKNYARVRNRISEVESKQGNLDRYILPVLGDMRLDEVKPLDVDRLAASMLATGVSNKTVNNALATLSKMFHYAVESELIAKVPRIRLLPVSECKTDYLKPDELVSLLEAASYNREWHDMIFVAARTGVRWGELSELRWSDVDLDAGMLHVTRNFVRGEVIDRKNGADVHIPLSPDTITLLKTRRQLRHLQGNALVFCKPDGGRHIHRRADVALKRCCRKAKLREISWHKLRH
ncbi:MAG: site-specific integrase, partial [Proteobacteria bacterium]|nr:site-specific integrase [Pseudomonadota bacterium]